MENKENLNKDVFLAKWIANEISDVDLRKLVSEAEYLDFLEIKKGLSLFESLEQNNKKSFEKIQLKIKSTNKTKVRKLYIQWATSIAACFVLFFGLKTFFGPNTVIERTNMAERQSFNLPDESQVMLSSNSKIEYDAKEWDNKRSLFLNGEAFFKVKKGSKFSVNTKKGQINVLGTSFTIKCYEDIFEVICYSGKVEVIENEKSYILTPKKGIRKLNNTSNRLDVDLVQPTWIKGSRTYKSVPLKVVLLDIEKEFDLNFDDKTINLDELFTGVLNMNNKELVFKTVFNAMGIKYSKKDSKTYQLTK